MNSIEKYGLYLMLLVVYCASASPLGDVLFWTGFAVMALVGYPLFLCGVEIKRYIVDKALGKRKETGE